MTPKSSTLATLNLARRFGAGAVVEDNLRLIGGDVTSTQIGHEVLNQLRLVDEVAYLRFASVYKNFDDAADFRRELALLEKRSKLKEPSA